MRNRRALSTVVGMVFAIIALTTTVTYITYSMNTLSAYNQSVVQNNQQLVDVGKEKFQITSVTYLNNKFSITVANTGNLPINFTKLWIQNMSNTDWYKSYTPTSNIVGPGGTVTIGQSFKSIASMTIDSTKSYNIKLTTSRGNTQQFTVNSASAAPLNIQLLAFPPSVPSGFTTQLSMIVTNNGSATLTNLIPILTLQSGTVCTAGAVSPSSYNTLAPGSSAVFTWSTSVVGSTNGATCTYRAKLQNGLSNNYADATITLSQVSFTSTNLAANTGVVTINYTSWLYSQGAGWQSNWSIPHGNPSVFNMTITNNDPTRTLWLSKNSLMVWQVIGSASTSGSYIVNATNPNVNPPTVTNSCTSNDYCISIAPGQSKFIYFGDCGAASLCSSSKGASTPTQTGATTSFILLYGKFGTQGGTSTYAQNIPYVAIFIT